MSYDRNDESGIRKLSVRTQLQMKQLPSTNLLKRTIDDTVWIMKSDITISEDDAQKFREFCAKIDEINRLVREAFNDFSRALEQMDDNLSADDKEKVRMLRSDLEY